MKRLFLIIAVTFVLVNIGTLKANAQTNHEPIVKIEIPAYSETNSVNYVREEPQSNTEKALNATKEATDKTIETTKKAAKKTVETTKDVKDKTVETTKNVTQKTVQTTKEVKDKTIDGTKDLIDNLNPNKPVTLEGLKSEATIKTLKNERKELKSAYNSRIKDVNAQIKATEQSTKISDVQKQNKIYMLNKEKRELEYQRNAVINKYNTRIQEAKSKNK